MTTAFAGEPAAFTEVRAVDGLRLLHDGSTFAVERADGRRLFGYPHRGVLRPGIHPVHVPGSTSVITRWMPGDHPWHYGIFTGLNLVDGLDLFCCEHGKRPKEVRGRRVLREVVAAPAGIGLRMTSDWQRPDGSPLIDEAVAIAVPGPGDDRAFAIDLEWTLTARSTVTVGKYPYGGLCVRLTGGRQDIRWLTADGARDIPARGDLVAARWVAIASVPARADGAPQTGTTAGIAVFDHPGNLRHPARWCGDAGCAFLNPCVVVGEALVLEAGRPLTVRYRLHVFAGEPDGAAIAAAWKAWTAPR